MAETRLLGSRLRRLISYSSAYGGRWEGQAKKVSTSLGALRKPATRTLQQQRSATRQEGSVPFDQRILRSSYHHRACGYLAGLHSHQPHPETEGVDEEEEPPEFDSFESAWEAIRLVPDQLLDDFEDELWETQSKRFVYGTKTVSVIDAVETVPESSSADKHQCTANKGIIHNGETDGTNGQQNSERVFRYLVLNERPHLIQTAIEVDCVGAPYYHSDGQELVSRPPSPISQTHLGGLAMALPFWRKANAVAGAPVHCRSNTRGGAENEGVGVRPLDDDFCKVPNCILLGAGGCSLAHTLAADLHRHYSHAQRPLLTAVEACPEILRASQLWFGAGDQKQNCHGTASSLGQNPLPASFDLVCDTGESYLRSLLSGKDESEPQQRMVDVLIIDAEDGSAPPKSMRTDVFWIETVLPALNSDRTSSHGGRVRPVVGVNAIGNESEITELMDTMRNAFDDYDSEHRYEILAVSPPAEAKVSNRHKLLFALPLTEDNASSRARRSYQNLFLTEDELKDCVDAPSAWEQQVRIALTTSATTA